MNVSAKTKKQLEDALNRVIEQCPSAQQTPLLSDIYFMFCPASGELCAFDDDDRELCRQVVSDWKALVAENAEEHVVNTLQEFLGEKRERIEALNLLRPFSFVLIDEDHETIADLYLVDDDTMLIPGELMEGLEEELDAFLTQLMKE